MTGAFPNLDSGWRALRSEFPAAARVTYLNTASAALLPRRAAEQGQRFYAEMLLEGDAARPRWESQRAHVRGQVAAILNASPAEIALTSGASQAFTLLAALLGPPSHVVAMRDEFPRVTIPFRRHGDQIAWVESGDTGDIPVVRIALAITPRTREVIASAVMLASGFSKDL